MPSIRNPRAESNCAETNSSSDPGWAHRQPSTCLFLVGTENSSQQEKTSAASWCGMSLNGHLSARWTLAKVSSTQSPFLVTVNYLPLPAQTWTQTSKCGTYLIANFSTISVLEILPFKNSSLAWVLPR